MTTTRAPRTRLSAEDRREQLLDLGVRLFAERTYDDVWIEEVAEAAGVSRGLLYHYFPTKRAFFAAMLRRESARMMEDTRPDPSLPLADQLRRGVETYLDHCRAHRQGVRAVFRGAASADPEVQEVVEAGTREQVERILEALSAPDPVDPLLPLTIRGWLMFLRTACHEWLDDDADAISRDDVRDVCMTALVAALAALPPHARPAGVTALL